MFRIISRVDRNWQSSQDMRLSSFDNWDKSTPAGLAGWGGYTSSGSSNCNTTAKVARPTVNDFLNSMTDDQAFRPVSAANQRRTLEGSAVSIFPRVPFSLYQRPTICSYQIIVRIAETTCSSAVDRFSCSLALSLTWAGAVPLLIVLSRFLPQAGIAISFRRIGQSP